MNKARVILAGPLQRKSAHAYVDSVPDGWVMTIQEPKRTDGQNERFHAICGDAAKSKHPWAGKPRSAAQWKVLFVSGHAKATEEEFDMVPGLESEFVNLRESTALMSIKRGSSLIEYATAFCMAEGIPLNDPRLAELEPA